MKRNDIAKLHTATTKELEQKIVDLQKELVITRLDVKMGKQTNLKKPNSIRKDIARIKTIIKQFELQTKKTN